MNSCLCQFYILVLLVCFLRLILHLCLVVHLYWRANQLKSENRRRFVFRVSCFVFCVSRFAFRVEGRTFVVFYGGFL